MSKGERVLKCLTSLGGFPGIVVTALGVLILLGIAVFGVWIFDDRRQVGPQRRPDGCAGGVCADLRFSVGVFIGRAGLQLCKGRPEAAPGDHQGLLFAWDNRGVFRPVLGGPRRACRLDRRLAQSPSAGARRVGGPAGRGDPTGQRCARPAEPVVETALQRPADGRFWLFDLLDAADPRHRDRHRRPVFRLSRRYLAGQIPGGYRQRRRRHQSSPAWDQARSGQRRRDFRRVHLGSLGFDHAQLSGDVSPVRLAVVRAAAGDRRAAR